MNIPRKKKLDFKKHIQDLTFKKVLLFLIVILVFVLILSQILYKPDNETRSPEQRLSAVNHSINELIKNSTSEVVIIDDPRILSYEEFSKLTKELVTEKQLVPSGRLLKTWLESDAGTPFNKGNAVDLQMEDVEIESPYKGL